MIYEGMTSKPFIERNIRIGQMVSSFPAEIDLTLSRCVCIQIIFQPFFVNSGKMSKNDLV